MAFYYPKSQIQTNLYTNGGEYMVASNKKEYVGYYYRLSTGKKYVGKVPGGSGRIEIIPLSSKVGSVEPPKGREIIYKPNYDGGESYLSPDSLVINDDYNGLTKSRNIANSRFAPTPYYSQPTPEEEKIGEYRRYFAKKKGPTGACGLIFVDEKDMLLKKLPDRRLRPYFC